MLKALIKFFKALNQNSNPSEIANAVCCGMILGFMPKNNALWYIIAIFCFFLRIQKGSYIISTFLFSLLSPCLDFWFDFFGYFILKLDFMQPVFVALMKIPLIGYTKFYNSIVMGSLLTSLILYIPMFFFVKFLIQLWRSYLVPVVRKTKLVKIVSKIPLIKKVKALI